MHYTPVTSSLDRIHVMSLVSPSNSFGSDENIYGLKYDVGRFMFVLRLLTFFIL